MEADFSGWATKAGLRCSDGKTIMPDAFKHQDQMKVPLVWQHGHNDPTNVVGHAILENKPEGVYAHCFFNATPKATHAKELVHHKDITMLSIWANQLIQRAGRVMHGVIREVSLVLSGANPGALIENVSIRHSDGEEVLNDEVIIYTGLTLELEHADTTNKKEDVQMAETKTTANEDLTVQDVYDSFTEEQKQVVHYLIGEALASAEDEMAQGAIDTDEINTRLSHIQEGIKTMGQHNIFETQGKVDSTFTLSHDDMKSIVSDAVKCGSLKEAVNAYVISHSITDIDLMFPDAKNVAGAAPEFLKRRTEWATKLLGATKKSPFSRIKTLWADLTYEQARAKGYVKGTLKKDEYFSVARRVTIPTTVYKKQKLDRDDIVDIVDFDVVVWLKGEMRLMLDEEVARAILIGDGRDGADEDKIDESCIRPIASDHELFTTQLYVNITDANSTIQEVIDSIILHRRFYKGTGNPTFFTTEYYISRFLLLKDTTGRRIYANLADLAVELRVADIVPVEAMEGDSEIVGVIVNPVDYTVGADRGGEVNMFDDFDIDYNQQKYLMETRVSGALTKLKSALCIRKTDAASVLVTPTAPTFDPETGEVTITNTTGVVYKNAAGVVINAAGSPYTVAPGATYTVNATPSSGYHFASTEEDVWTFTMDA